MQQKVASRSSLRLAGPFRADFGEGNSSRETLGYALLAASGQGFTVRLEYTTLWLHVLRMVFSILEFTNSEVRRDALHTSEASTIRPTFPSFSV
jgi:hypothetical protein